MDNLLKAIVTGAASFAATNIDDIFVLMLFFGQRNKSVKVWHIVAGQYIGFAALVAISLVGYFARYVAPREWIGLLGLLPIAIGVKKLIEWRKAKGDVSHDEVAEEAETRNSALSVLTVSAVTFANGADNISIYTPLFAASGLRQIVVTLAVFFVLLGVWCAAGHYFGSHPLVAKTLERYGHIIVPFVLIALGLYIIYDSGTLALL